MDARIAGHAVGKQMIVRRQPNRLEVVGDDLVGLKKDERRPHDLIAFAAGPGTARRGQRVYANGAQMEDNGQASQPDKPTWNPDERGGVRLRHGEFSWGSVSAATLRVPTLP